jgi:hypothetical protein
VDRFAFRSKLVSSFTSAVANAASHSSAPLFEKYCPRDQESVLSCKEYDNAQAVEIVLKGRVSTEDFDSIAAKLEAFIDRHGHVRVLEIIQDFEGMDAVAFWHDIKFSLRHLKDFSRMLVCNPDTHHLWFSLVAPVEHFAPVRKAKFGHS